MSEKYILVEDFQTTIEQIPTETRDDALMIGNVLLELDRAPTYTPAEILAGMWVPVTERLPKPFESVCVSAITSDCATPVRLVGFVEKGGNWYVHDFSGCSHLVTHWMPLPASPKE